MNRDESLLEVGIVPHKKCKDCVGCSVATFSVWRCTVKKKIIPFHFLHGKIFFILLYGIRGNLWIDQNNQEIFMYLVG